MAKRETVWIANLYLRLSKEDRHQANAESISIETQRMKTTDFAEFSTTAFIWEKQMADVTAEIIGKRRAFIEKIGKSETPREAANHAMEFQHQVCVIGKNQMAALIITSFRMPCIAMWQRFCRIYGIDTLYEHTKRSWECIKNRDYAAAMEWFETFMADAIDGSYTLYEEDLLT